MWFDAARHDQFLVGLEDAAAQVATEARELAEHDDAAAVEALWQDVRRCIEDLVAALAAAEALRQARTADENLGVDACGALTQLGAVTAAFRRRYQSYDGRLDEEAMAEEARLRERLEREALSALHEAAAAGNVLHLETMAEPAWRSLMDASREILARLVLVEAKGVDLDAEALALSLARSSEKMITDARELWALNSGDGAAAA